MGAWAAIAIAVAVWAGPASLPASAQGVGSCLLRDGTVSMTGNLDMDSNDILNLGTISAHTLSGTLTGGVITNATIGAASPSTIVGTTVDATTDFTVDGLVLTADTITNDAALTVTTNAGGIRFSPASTIGYGVAPQGYAGISIRPALTSSDPEAVEIRATLTQSSNGNADQVVVNGGTLSVNDGVASARATTAFLAEPNITLNGSASVVTASTLWIHSAPTEASANYAVLVNAGNVQVNDGLIVGSPTGTGATFAEGRIGAEAVYDDNTLLSDWVVELWRDGRVSPASAAWWDGSPYRTLDAARAAAVREARLPWMPTRAEWMQSELSLGGMVTQLWVGQEHVLTYVLDLEERIEALEARIAEMEGK